MLAEFPTCSVAVIYLPNQGEVCGNAPGSGSVLGPRLNGKVQSSSRNADMNEAAAAADASACR